ENSDWINALRKDVILADCLQVAALLQQRVHRVLHEPKVKSTAHLVATSRLAAQQLGAGNVDDVDSARGDEHSFLPRIFLVDAMKCVFEVFDRAEEDRSVNAEHLELRAVGQARIGIEVEM